MSPVGDRFAALVHNQEPDLPGPVFLPERLAIAAVGVLPKVDGAGISVLSHPTTRVPVGASDPLAAAAERLQFTIGEGPCLHAYATGQPVLAPAAVFAQQWPVLYEELLVRTPFRAVISLPLRHDTYGIGAVDLHFRTIDLPDNDLTDAYVVADQIAAALGDSTLQDAGAGDPAEPPWLDSAPAVRRYRVWLAMGMVSVHLDIPTADAFDVLRGMAFTRGLDIDDLADQITQRRVSLSEVPPLPS